MHDVTGDRVFTPEVLVADPGRELRWIGRLWGWGFFDGEHSFMIDEIAPGRVRLTQREEFRGILVPFLAGSLHKNTQPQFAAMNQALAERLDTLARISAEVSRRNLAGGIASPDAWPGRR